MNALLRIEIEAFSVLEEHGTKQDGTPDVRMACGWHLRVVRDMKEIVAEHELPLTRPSTVKEELVEMISNELGEMARDVFPLTPMGEVRY